MTFSEAYKMFSAQGKMSLRRYQFKMAEHNPTMAIWLGKQILGQADVVTIKSVDDSELEELEKLVLIDENDNEKTGD